MENLQPQSVILLQGKFGKTFFDRFSAEHSHQVFVLEGRPDLQASRQTARELLKRNCVPTVIADNMAGFLFGQGWVKEVCLAYHRKFEDGFLCDIGGSILAVLGKRHNVPVKMFAGRPQKKFLGTPKDIFYFQGKKVAPLGIAAYVPLVEEVPLNYVSQVHE